MLLLEKFEFNQIKGFQDIGMQILVKNVFFRISSEPPAPQRQSAKISRF